MFRRTSIIVCLIILALAAYAGGARYSCTRHLDKTVRTRGFLGYPSRDWDPQRTYRQAVILVTFKDQDFTAEDPVAHYQRMLNERGYNEGAGAGCAADYYRDQSGGLLNLQFDVYGPVRVDTVVRGNGKDNYGDYVVRKATRLAIDSLQVDFSPYDWDDDGKVDQVIFIAAGFCGQVGGGYIWPNTGSMYGLKSGSLSIPTYSISCECWGDGSSCGIGTICHEFAHCLGLPDLYPVNGVVFSAVDEWDLMDGGNYTNKGWCPPNFSALEKMLLGWATPEELISPTKISGMKSVADGGKAYLIRNSGHENEFYLLENRQWKDWDYGVPGQGLLITHVDYDREVWSDNNVNIDKNHFRYDIVHADGLDYSAWESLVKAEGRPKYTEEPDLRNCFLSSSVYPWKTDSTTFVNTELSNGSVPSAIVFKANEDGDYYLSKPITNIQLSASGEVSFDFMQIPSGLPALPSQTSVPVAYYDLSGHRLPGPPSAPGIYIVRYADGTTKKSIH